jgi:hypothetical protein
MSRGYLALVLHAHLPFVRHPAHPYFLEEQWFFQAMTETYIPLIHVFEGHRPPAHRLASIWSPEQMAAIRYGVRVSANLGDLLLRRGLAGRKVFATAVAPHGVRVPGTAPPAARASS